MILGGPPYSSPYSITQQIVVVLFAPPILAGILILMFRIRAHGLGTENSNLVKNTTDWVAYFAFTGALYAMGIGVLLYAHFAGR
jgi:hypothetical protein